MRYWLSRTRCYFRYTPRRGKGGSCVLSRRNFLARASALAAFAWTNPKLVAGDALPIPSSSQPASAQPAQSQSSDPALLDRARALLQEAPLIDTHNDLPSMLLELHGDLARYDLGKLQS